MLIAARALLGVAAATLPPSSLALIRNMLVDEEQRGQAIADLDQLFRGRGGDRPGRERRPARAVLVGLGVPRQGARDGGAAGLQARAPGRVPRPASRPAERREPRALGRQRARGDLRPHADGRARRDVAGAAGGRDGSRGGRGVRPSPGAAHRSARRSAALPSLDPRRRAGGHARVRLRHLRQRPVHGPVPAARRAPQPVRGRALAGAGRHRHDPRGAPRPVTRASDALRTDGGRRPRPGRGRADRPLRTDGGLRPGAARGCDGDGRPRRRTRRQRRHGHRGRRRATGAGRSRVRVVGRPRPSSAGRSGSQCWAASRRSSTAPRSPTRRPAAFRPGRATRSAREIARHLPGADRGATARRRARPSSTVSGRCAGGRGQRRRHGDRGRAESADRARGVVVSGRASCARSARSRGSCSGAGPCG
jgi:hypothetical protein